MITTEAETKSESSFKETKTSDANGTATENVDLNVTNNPPADNPPPPAPRKLAKLEADLYFANSEERLKRAGEKLRTECLINDLDGDFLKLFVLTEIDHWNHDRERVVVLCEQSVLSVNYSFITEKWSELTRMSIKCILSVQFGDLVFPKRSLQWPRPEKVVKISYQRLTGPVTVSESWNPFSKHLPWSILTSHPLAHRVDGENDRYTIESFKGDLLEAIEKYRVGHPDAPHSPEIREEQIEMNIRLGLSSFVVNQSHLAYAKDRGGVHF